MITSKTTLNLHLEFQGDLVFNREGRPVAVENLQVFVETKEGQPKIELTDFIDESELGELGVWYVEQH